MSPRVNYVDGMSATQGRLRGQLRQLADAIDPAAEPLTFLGSVTDLAQQADLIRNRLAYECVQAGASYADVARQLGISREAVRKRYGR